MMGSFLRNALMLFVWMCGGWWDSRKVNMCLANLDVGRTTPENPTGGQKLCCSDVGENMSVVLFLFRRTSECVASPALCAGMTHANFDEQRHKFTAPEPQCDDVNVCFP